jgi:hypothetical protein
MKRSKQFRLWALCVSASILFGFFAGCRATGHDASLLGESFKLSYDAGDGSGTVPQEQNGTLLTVAPGDGLTKGGQAFKFWADALGKVYDPGAEIELGEDIILYAWYEGSGTDTDPYLISNSDDLMNIETEGFYKVANDFVITGEWTTLDIEFKGEIDGAGHTITFDDVKIIEIEGDDDKCALMAELGTNAVIKNLVFDGEVSMGPFSDETRAGGLAAMNYGGLIINCGIKTSYTIETEKSLVFGAYCGEGGGASFGSGGSGIGSNISNSFVSGDIHITYTNDAESYDMIRCGGFNGCMGGALENCYSKSNITLTATDKLYIFSLGGIVGGTDTNAGSQVKSCYATGTISAIGADNGFVCGITGDKVGGTILNSAALNAALNGPNTNRVFFTNGSEPCTNCYGRTDMMGGAWTSSATGKDGADVTLVEIEAESWWKDTLDWANLFGSSDSAPWKWDAVKKRPVLYWE